MASWQVLASVIDSLRECECVSEKSNEPMGYVLSEESGDERLAGDSGWWRGIEPNVRQCKSPASGGSWCRR